MDAAFYVGIIKLHVRSSIEMKNHACSVAYVEEMLTAGISIYECKILYAIQGNNCTWQKKYV
jgi:hypothetical protein